MMRGGIVINSSAAAETCIIEDYDGMMIHFVI
jgi:hypothetical protein